MQSFETIRDRAAARKGGKVALEALIADGTEIRDVASLTDDRILSEFSKRVFQAGFNWKVIETKWPGFETAFNGFDPGWCAMIEGDRFDALITDTGIVRHAAKITSVRDNAIFLLELAEEHGSTAAEVIGNWPPSDQIGLMELMKKRGTRLGGATGQYALRFLGRDGFILSGSVVAALKEAGVIDGPATSKTALTKIQTAFNQWHAESGETYKRISRILALSTDG